MIRNKPPAPPPPPPARLVRDDGRPTQHACAISDSGKVVCLKCNRSWRVVDDDLFANGPCYLPTTPDRFDHVRLRVVEAFVALTLLVTLVAVLAG